MKRFLAVVSIVCGAAIFEGREAVADLAIPSSTRQEHEQLLAGLREAVNSGGKTGAAAVNLERVLMPHFEREEEFALPPLGALLPCAQGKLTPEIEARVRPLLMRLRSEMPSMLSEHREIAAAVSQLRQTALIEQKTSVALFADELSLHARSEEEVTYPAALVVGECRVSRSPSGGRIQE